MDGVGFVNRSEVISSDTADVSLSSQNGCIKRLDDVSLCIEPRVQKTYERFRLENPAYSIALDGYVWGRPVFDRTGPHVNFNHHEDVDRLGTRSTCAQVFLAIKQGLFETFFKDGRPFANVFANDPDQDTSLAIWELQNHELLEANPCSPYIRRLVAIEDILDCTAGAYPEIKDSFAEELAWIFEPYRIARLLGQIPEMNGEKMYQIVAAVSERITAHVNGRGDRLELDTRYEIIGGGKGWKMIREIGSDARTALFADGVRAYVSVREGNNGAWVYSIGKMSPFIQLDLTKFSAYLNRLENLNPDSGHSWGGGDTIIGSPRSPNDYGTKIPPAELQKILDDFIIKNGQMNGHRDGPKPLVTEH